jgi:hypothetical protein
VVLRVRSREAQALDQAGQGIFPKILNYATAPCAPLGLPAGVMVFYGVTMDNSEAPMATFQPRLDILPWALWAELGATPDHFTLYGETALALRLGHRQSADFDFFFAQRFQSR